MPLIVQTNLGAAGADSYVSLAEANAYFTARSNATWDAADDEVKEAALRAATQYVDTIVRYKGVRLSASQDLEWPRSGVTDWSGYEVAGVPSRVKQATSELALRALSEDLYVDLDRGGAISSESVGPISVSYRGDAPVGKTFRSAMQLLAPYVRAVDDLAMPHKGDGDAADPIFTIGMFDDNGGDERLS